MSMSNLRCCPCRYKREAYRHSEFAARLLAKEGIDVVMKVRIAFNLISPSRSHPYHQSDHPAIVSRNLVHEAAVAHYHGLPEHIALASVISTPAKVLGLDHRIGFIAEGARPSYYDLLNIVSSWRFAHRV